MIKINLSKKNKRILLVALWVLAVIILYATYNYLNNKKDSEVEPEPVVYHELDFDYPVNWSKDSKSYDSGDIDHDVYSLTSENKDFEIKIEYRVVNSYEEETGSSFYPSESITNDYNKDAFEVITEIQSGKLLIPINGSARSDSDGILQVVDFVVDEPNYVYQEYEDAGGLSITISAVLDPEVSVPVGYKGIMVTYVFHSQESIDNWDYYKTVLKNVVSSLKLN